MDPHQIFISNTVGIIPSFRGKKYEEHEHKAKGIPWNLSNLVK